MTADRPTLREALRHFGELLAAEGYGWEAIITRETSTGERTVAHLTTSNPDPAALATPAPLDVERRLFEAVRRVIRDGIDSPGTYDELHAAYGGGT